MFTLDEQFLADLGLGGLPDRARDQILQRTLTELEMRVGATLTDGLSDELLDEFGAFVDHNEEVTLTWLAANAPNWNSGTGLPSGISPENPYDAAAMLWLRRVRPDYPEVVSTKLDELRLELIESRGAIRAQFAA